MSKYIVPLNDPRISIFANEEGVSIEIHDHESGLDLISLELTPEQFAQALSRLKYTEVKKLEVNTFAFENLNKKRVLDSFVFVAELEKPYGLRDEEIYKLAVEYAKEKHPGWIVQNYFGSQNQVRLLSGKKYSIKVNILKYE